MRPAVPLLVLVVALAAPAQVARADDTSTLGLREAPARAELGAMSHVWQTWNNCGPASIVMALSSFGYDVSQEEARLALRGPDVRRGMPAQNVDPWLRARLGLRAIARTDGTVDQVKRLVANGFPVVVTQWLEDGDRIAHYRVVRGYSDADRVFFVNDPMRGANVALTYDWFAANWRDFSYRYLVVYRPEDEAKVKALVGADWDEVAMRERLYLRTQVDAERLGTAGAWLAYGEAAYQYGKFAEAVAAFEHGLSLGSPTGIFTLRVSYPMSLRLEHRLGESDAASAKFASLTSATVHAPESADAIGLALFASRVPRLVAE